jgi:hypothetical protein
MHLEQVMPLSNAAPGVSREFLMEALPGNVSSFQLEDASIVVSEFVALALAFSTSGPLLGLDIEPDLVRMTIHGLPLPADDIVRGMDAISRDIVDTMADRWGATEGQDGTDLWFEMIPEAGMS